MDKTAIPKDNRLPILLGTVSPICSMSDPLVGESCGVCRQ